MIGKIRQVYQMLEDGQSKETYLAWLNYLITGDFNHLGMIIKKHMPPVLVPYDTLLYDSLPKDKKIILYGTAAEGQSHLHFFENDKRFIGFCGRDPEKQKNGFNGYPVISLEQLLQMEDVSVVISAGKAREEIKGLLKQGNFPESRIFDIPKNYVWDALEEENTFEDRGLGTSLELSTYGIKLKERYVLKSDGNDEDGKPWCIDPTEFGHFETWNELKARHGGAYICEDRGAGFEMVSVDEAVAGQDRITFIKADAGGFELELLKSAQTTILRDKPKLVIYIHHNPGDIVDIPMYIKKMVPEYKLYIRYRSNGPGETVLYAVMP